MEQVLFKKKLKGKRLVLKEHPITFEHAREAFEVIESNREIFEKYFPLAEKTKSAEDYFEYFLLNTKGKMDSGKTAEYAIYLGEIFIGQIGFFDISLTNESGEIGYWLDKNHTGNGYMQEAIEILEDYIFSLGFYRIQIRHDNHNPKSKNSIEKSGYVLEGISKNASVIQGNRYDIYNYSKIKSK